MWIIWGIEVGDDEDVEKGYLRYNEYIDYCGCIG